jgi:hypothetical protein
MTDKSKQQHPTFAESLLEAQPEATPPVKASHPPHPLSHADEHNSAQHQQKHDAIHDARHAGKHGNK